MFRRCILGIFLLLGGNNNMASKETMLKELGISKESWEFKTDGKSLEEAYKILEEIYENHINKEYEKLGELKETFETFAEESILSINKKLDESFVQGDEIVPGMWTVYATKNCGKAYFEGFDDTLIAFETFADDLGIDPEIVGTGDFLSSNEGLWMYDENFVNFLEMNNEYWKDTSLPRFDKNLAYENGARLFKTIAYKDLEKMPFEDIPKNFRKEDIQKLVDKSVDKALDTKGKRNLQLKNAYIDGYNAAKNDFDSKLDKLADTIISTANVDYIFGDFDSNEKDIFKGEEIQNPHKFLKDKTYKTSSGPSYFSNNETIESAYERGIAGFEDDASDVIRDYDNYYKDGEFMDEPVYARKDPDEILCGMNFDREYAEGLLEASIKETLNKNSQKEETVSDIIGDIKLCKEEQVSEQSSQTNKNTQKM